MLTLANRLMCSVYAPQTLTFVSTTWVGGYSQDITFPADIEAGDLILVHQVMAEGNQASNPSQTGLAYSGDGFTRLYSQRSITTVSPYESVHHYASYKIANGTEASATISGWFDLTGLSFVYTRAAISIYRPSKPITAVNAALTINFTNWESSPNGGAVTLVGSNLDVNQAALYVMFQGNSQVTTAYTWGGSSDYNAGSGGTYTDSRLVLWADPAGNIHPDISASDTSTNAMIHFLCYRLQVL